MCRIFFLLSPTISAYTLNAHARMYVPVCVRLSAAWWTVDCLPVHHARLPNTNRHTRIIRHTRINKHTRIPTYRWGFDWKAITLSAPTLYFTPLHTTSTQPHSLANIGISHVRSPHCAALIPPLSHTTRQVSKDIEYVIRNEDSIRYLFASEKGASDLKRWFELLSMFEGMDAHKRRKLHHIEYPR